MKTYESLMALSAKQRANELVTCVTTAISRQKQLAKVLVAMVASGDCKAGEMRKHADTLSGTDIRREMQNVYELTAVFQAVVDKTIEVTEEEFDALDMSKLALLSPFLSKDELKPKLGEAVNAAKTGTAKDIRNLKPKAQKADEKTGSTDKPEGVEIPIGFVATDIGKTDALATSRQFKDRVQADLVRACETGDADALESIKDVFGKVFAVACEALGEDPLDFLANLAAAAAKPAAGTVVETPALAAA